jgi:hypothetical protein
MEIDVALQMFWEAVSHVARSLDIQFDDIVYFVKDEDTDSISLLTTQDNGEIACILFKNEQDAQSVINWVYNGTGNLRVVKTDVQTAIGYAIFNKSPQVLLVLESDGADALSKCADITEIVDRLEQCGTMSIVERDIEESGKTNKQ